MDFRHDRISNGLIAAGILSGLFLDFLADGWPGLLNGAAAMVISFVLLYPIYKIGAFGAGDVKLFIMTGGFTGPESILRIIAAAFLIGAVFSIVKMISEANFSERMRYLFSYISEAVRGGEWRLYGEDADSSYKKYKSGRIHFALPICCSALLWSGGLF